MMNYCYECGTRLEIRELQGEGAVPYCTGCGKFVFPVFSTAVSMIVLSPDRSKILLIRQYGSDTNILVAGYVNKGEDAEAAVIREVREEIGLEVSSLHFNHSAYFEKSNTLMLNFDCTAESEGLEGVNASEVDHAQWFTYEQAVREIRHGSLAERFLLGWLKMSEADRR